MDKHSTVKASKLYFLPVILGNNKRTRSLARHIYRKYGAVSYIVTDKPYPLDALSLCYRSLYLPKAPEPQIVCRALTDLCLDNPYNLPILVRSDDVISSLISEYIDSLESFFVLSDTESILQDSPLTRTK